MEKFKAQLQSTDILLKEILPEETTNALEPVIERKPRGILDIFTPYSINSIGDTVNANYDKMNHNFEKVHVTELKLQHQQMIIANNIGQMNKNELNLVQKEMFLEIKLFQEHMLTNFIFQLQKLIKKKIGL